MKAEQSTKMFNRLIEQLNVDDFSAGQEFLTGIPMGNPVPLPVYHRRQTASAHAVAYAHIFNSDMISEVYESNLPTVLTKSHLDEAWASFFEVASVGGWVVFTEHVYMAMMQLKIYRELTYTNDKLPWAHQTVDKLGQVNFLPKESLDMFLSNSCIRAFVNELGATFTVIGDIGPKVWAGKTTNYDEVKGLVIYANGNAEYLQNGPAMLTGFYSKDERLMLSYCIINYHLPLLSEFLVLINGIFDDLANLNDLEKMQAFSIISHTTYQVCNAALGAQVVFRAGVLEGNSPVELKKDFSDLAELAEKVFERYYDFKNLSKELMEKATQQHKPTSPKGEAGA